MYSPLSPRPSPPPSQTYGYGLGQLPIQTPRTPLKTVSLLFVDHRSHQEHGEGQENSPRFENIQRAVADIFGSKQECSCSGLGVQPLGATPPSIEMRQASSVEIDESPPQTPERQTYLGFVQASPFQGGSSRVRNLSSDPSSFCGQLLAHHMESPIRTVEHYPDGMGLGFGFPGQS
ncbi:MAG: hypothetical protein S4CHLAM6_10120 [Chlamydiae bacterium]|nr:hypothetical protein [Chlamydiota bacterium]